MSLVLDHPLKSNSDLGGKANDKTCSMSKPVVEVEVCGMAADGRLLRGFSGFLGNEESFHGKRAGPPVPQSSLWTVSPVKTTEGGGIRGFDAHKRERDASATF